MSDFPFNTTELLRSKHTRLHVANESLEAPCTHAKQIHISTITSLNRSPIFLPQSHADAAAVCKVYQGRWSNSECNRTFMEYNINVEKKMHRTQKKTIGVASVRARARESDSRMLASSKQPAMQQTMRTIAW